MLNEYRKEMTLSSAYLNRDCRLGLFQSGLLLQDAVTELFEQYHCDAVRLSQTHGAVWAVARTKFRILERPFWLDRLVIRAYPVKITPATVHVEMAVETPAGRPLLWGKQELCVFDVTDHSLRRVSSTPFPMGETLPPSAFTQPYRRMKFQIEPHGFLHTVRTTDTDMNGHLNNVASLRLAVDALPSAYWADHPVSEADIHYTGEGMEGQTIAVCHAETEEGVAVQLKEGERTVVRAFFCTDTAREDCIPPENPVH